jgi:hypothetical protein
VHAVAADRVEIPRWRARAERLVVLCGAPGSGRCAIARAAATELGRPVVVEELDAHASDDARRRELRSALVRARIANVVLAIRWRTAPRDPAWRVLGRVAATGDRDIATPA